MQLVKPPKLQPNSVIGIIAPSSPLREIGGAERLEQGIRYLESLGYRVELGKSVYSSTHYLAGDDSTRLDDFVSMMTNPNISAVFCSRGGYGSMRFLSRIPYELIRSNPKIFVTFSDGTALNSALYSQAGLITFSGAMVGVDMHNFDSESEEFFWRILTSTAPIGKIHTSMNPTLLHISSRNTTLASGRLICGNLTLFASLCGSLYLPDMNDTILLTEDIGEEPYRIDRMLSQLELSGVLRQTNSLLFGSFTEDVNRTSSTPSRPIVDVLSEYAVRNGKSTIGSIMYGHTSKKLTLPFGVQCGVDYSTCTFSLDEAGVR
jgi:muramoyltetrapeptide carboxypeptidase